MASSLAIGMVAFGPNPGFYKLLMLWPSIGLMLFSPAHQPTGLGGRLVVALNHCFIVIVPLLAGLVALTWLLEPDTAWSGLDLVANLVLLASVWQGIAVVLWIIAVALTRPALATTEAAQH